MLKHYQKRLINKARNSYLVFEDEMLIDYVKANRKNNPFGAYFNNLTNSISALVQAYLIKSNQDYLLSHIEYKLLEMYSLGKDLVVLAHKHDPNRFPLTAFRLIKVDEFNVDDYVDFAKANLKESFPDFPLEKIVSYHVLASIQYMYEVFDKKVEIPQIRDDFEAFLE